jgi:hypothetical protein
MHPEKRTGHIIAKNRLKAHRRVPLRFAVPDANDVMYMEPPCRLLRRMGICQHTPARGTSCRAAAMILFQDACAGQVPTTSSYSDASDWRWSDFNPHPPLEACAAGRTSTVSSGRRNTQPNANRCLRHAFQPAARDGVPAAEADAVGAVGDALQRAFDSWEASFLASAAFGGHGLRLNGLLPG